MSLTSPRLPLTSAARQHRIPRWLLATISPVVALLLWELSVTVGLIDGSLFAPPSKIPGALLETIQNGTLLHGIGVSALRAAAGLFAGTVLGVAAAVVAGLWRGGDLAINPIAQLLRPLPATALTTLFILLFGIGEFTKVLIIAFGTFFPVYLNTLHGIRSVDVKLVELAAVSGFTRRRLIREVVVPSATPDFFVGFRFSASVAWLLLVVAEQINAKAGLGYILTEAQRYFRTDIIVGVLIVYALLGLITDKLIVSLSRGVLRWRTEYGG